ncbi:helix-turn-helix domain-containing protein [Erwinia sp. CGal63]|uniref:helix-turn-helix domain-containing protein n=1 Tax=Erwinia sp. CGal63 TaxID=2919889 RepID=UPI003009E52C
MSIIIDGNLDAVRSLNEFQQNLLRRIHNIGLALMPEFADKAQAMEAVSLDDRALMQRLYATLLEQNIRVSESERQKTRRRKENLEKFYAQLEEMGGTMKVNDVAAILGISRQGVHARLKKNRLLAFKQNGDFIFPRFQFAEKGLLPGFAEVMEAFGPGLHPMMILNALRSPVDIKGNGVWQTPVEIMQNGANPEALKILVRNAALLSQQAGS